ncbi:cytochrome c3 family protein [Sinimarinibacterium thermocellulolyticum]|uniref:Cytochrome c3 family protein n=1 Tax=Sinimarinibacterium thermocellulolyticum TaxID=3170016 RepID=A0ABV2A6A5_9GAMM
MILVRRQAPDGAQTEQVVSGAVTIGRATDNTIPLSGLLVALHHARLTPGSGATLQLECLGAVDVIVNGLVGQRSAVLAPGDELRIGGHRLCVSVDGDGGLVLEVRECDPQGATGGDGAITSLDAAGWRMRRPAVIAAALVLLVCLMVPLVLRAVSAPAWVEDRVPSDRWWTSGAISNAHLQFGAECEVCHEQPFVRVRDEACLSCHAAVAHHGDDLASMQDAGLDQQRCASCHFEHGGTQAVLPDHPALCADCHAQPGDFAGLDGVGSAADFATAHPPFRVTVTTMTPTGPQTQRRLLAPDGQDVSGLIFPHDLHLDERGVRGPNGRQVLRCADCHRPGPGAVGFEPLRFETDCQRCHQLDVDVGGLPFRLPHGDADAVRTLLQSAVSMTPVELPESEPSTNRRRPGERADRGDPSSAPDPIDEVFERRVCAKCHEIDKPQDQLVRVREPILRKTWMPMARFTHEPHRWVNCDTCHAASVSSDSNDLLLPQIESCRGCHGGVGSSARIQSTCIDCHRFHQAKDLTMSKFMGELANGQTLESRE